MAYTLYIGNKNYSSWSLRGWLAAKLSGAPFREVLIQLARNVQPRQPGVLADRAACRRCTTATIHVWDSLAIGEYLAERHPGMWPADPVARAWARSIAAEMHSGFSALRNEMTMCIRERVDVRPWSDGARREYRARRRDLEREHAAASARAGRICWARRRSPTRSMRRWPSASRPTA